MKRQAFEQRNEQSWQELEQAVATLDKREPLQDIERVPGLFRRVCGDLALAQHRMYGRRLCERLNALVIGTYALFPRATNRSGASALRFFVITFPRAVRAEWRLFWINMVLMFVPMFAFIAAAIYEPAWIFTVLSPGDQAQMDMMYGADSVMKGLRGEFESDFVMWAFYIQNNVSIGFRIFAGGVLATLGAIFFMAFNGIHIGAAVGYVHYAGHTDNFYRFVVGHSSLELVGFVICSVAGMRLGLALLNPGRFSRGDALRVAGARALPVLYGGALMIFLAAFVEGYWSASDASPAAKYTVGAVLWVLMSAYFIFSGRRANEA